MHERLYEATRMFFSARITIHSAMKYISIYTRKRDVKLNGVNEISTN